jgi:hypothetical protein
LGRIVSPFLGFGLILPLNKIKSVKFLKLIQMFLRGLSGLNGVNEPLSFDDGINDTAVSDLAVSTACLAVSWTPPSF